MEANGQTLYNDDLLNILPDEVIILDINREVIQLNQQAFTELHVHSSVNAMMPLPTNKIFKLLNKKEDILSTILKKSVRAKKYTHLLSLTLFICQSFFSVPSVKLNDCTEEDNGSNVSENSASPLSGK